MFKSMIVALPLIFGIQAAEAQTFLPCGAAVQAFDNHNKPAISLAVTIIDGKFKELDREQIQQGRASLFAPLDSDSKVEVMLGVVKACRGFPETPLDDFTGSFYKTLRNSMSVDR